MSADDKKDFFNGFDDDILSPEDFEEEETEKEETESKDDDKSDVEATENEETESKTEDETEPNVKEEEESEADKKARELHERNEQQKAKRLEREKKAQEEHDKKIRDEAKMEAELESTKKNPYTDKPIKDAYDLEIYKMMKEIDEKGGDPVNDLPAQMAEKERQRVQKQNDEIKAKEDANARLLNEIDSFHRRNKNVPSKDELIEMGFLDKVDTYDPEATYAERVYMFLDEYNSAKKKSDENRSRDAVEKGSKKVTKVPNPNNNGKTDSGDINYMEMSDEDYIKLKNNNNGDFF